MSFSSSTLNVSTYIAAKSTMYKKAGICSLPLYCTTLRKYQTLSAVTYHNLYHVRFLKIQHNRSRNCSSCWDHGLGSDRLQLTALQRRSRFRLAVLGYKGSGQSPCIEIGTAPPAGVPCVHQLNGGSSIENRSVDFLSNRASSFYIHSGDCSLAETRSSCYAPFGSRGNDCQKIAIHSFFCKDS